MFPITLLLLFPLIIESKVGDWMNWGADLTNRRYNPDHLITPQNIKNLTLAWRIILPSHMRSTPSVTDGIVYFPCDSNKTTIYAVNGSSGKVIWSRDGFITRTTPIIYGDMLLMGTLTGFFFALNRTTGETIWQTEIFEPGKMPQVSQSGTVTTSGLYLVGLTSDEETSTDCCDFRGRMYALNATTGDVVWVTYTVPESNSTPGYAGASIWASAPAVNETLGLVFVATGNNYQVPPDVQNCLLNLLPGQSPFLCQDANNYDDSILALNLSNGKIMWSFSAFGVDWWSFGCNLGVAGYCSNNSQVPGHDWDFAQAPLMFTTSTGQNLVGAGNKGGIFFALDSKTGKQVWATQVCPGSEEGGMLLGSSADEKYIYVGYNNFFLRNYTLQNGTVVCVGVWMALDIDTGKIIWQTPDPHPLTFEQCLDPLELATPPTAWAPLSTGNGIVYAPSYRGLYLAMNRDNGEILWSYPVDNIVGCGPALTDNYIYWGAGYLIQGKVPLDVPGSLSAFKV